MDTPLPNMLTDSDLPSGPPAPSSLPGRMLWRRLDSGTSGHTSCCPPSSGGMWAWPLYKPDLSLGNIPESPEIDRSNTLKCSQDLPPTETSSSDAAPTCLSLSRSPWIRKVSFPSSSLGSSLQTPTLLRHPSCASQPPLESSLVITNALTRTM